MTTLALQPATQKDLTTLGVDLRQEMSDLGVDLRQEMSEMGSRLERHMGVLMEDVQQKLEILIEGMQHPTQRVASHEKRITRLEDEVAILNLARSRKS